MLGANGSVLTRDEWPDRSRRQSRVKVDMAPARYIDRKVREQTCPSLAMLIENERVRFVTYHGVSQDPEISKQYLLTYFGEIEIKLNCLLNTQDHNLLFYENGQRILSPENFGLQIDFDDRQLKKLGIKKVYGVAQGNAHLLLRHKLSGAYLGIRGQKIKD